MAKFDKKFEQLLDEFPGSIAEETPKKRKKGINGKKKGSRVELEFVKILSDRFKQDFRRVPMSGGWGTMNAGSAVRQDAKEILSGDIICPVDFKFSIESKGRSEFNFWDMLSEETEEHEIKKWMRQALEEARVTGKEPLILIKVNRRQPFAMFPEYLMKTKLSYNGFSILRLDYLLALNDDFFFSKDKGDSSSGAPNES